MSWQTDFDNEHINPKDPNPWLALYLDKSLPISDEAKRALLRGNNTWSRKILLPIVRPLAGLSIILVQLLRMIIPDRVSSSRILHKTIYWGLKHFVRTDANMLILRHFNIGTELLQFVADNAGIKIESTTALRPTCLEDLLNDTFLIHDLNIYNFILELNTKLSADERELIPPEQLNLDAISPDGFDIDPGEEKWTNRIDIHTAIQMYTPLYALFLSDADFWRASNSLQLDETLAIYISKLLGDSIALNLVSNRHPMVPVITLQAGFRLMVHGLDAELLHGHLNQMKRARLGS